MVVVVEERQGPEVMELMNLTCLLVLGELLGLVLLLVLVLVCAW